MSRIARTAGLLTLFIMTNTLQVFQLNVGKRDMVQQSVMNDEQLKKFSVIAIQEPHAWKSKGIVAVTPLRHTHWSKVLPTKQQGKGWAIRSMLWIRRDLEFEQIPVESSDITAGLLHLPTKTILVGSVYVPGVETSALERSMRLLQRLVRDAKAKANTQLEILLTGDFNRHDQLWGGDEIAARQGEAEPIIDLMNDLALQSLLLRGTITWQGGDHESTIDLVLASEYLTERVTKCKIHETEHGSDHRVIETAFDIEAPTQERMPRLLFKNAPWKAIKERVAARLQHAPWEIGVQQQTDQLMKAVQEAVEELDPKAKPSPYAKRWWSEDLTQLRQVYTH